MIKMSQGKCTGLGSDILFAILFRKLNRASRGFLAERSREADTRPFISRYSNCSSDFNGPGLHISQPPASLHRNGMVPSATIVLHGKGQVSLANLEAYSDRSCSRMLYDIS